MTIDLLIAQFSDTHVTTNGRLLHDRYDSAATLTKCFEHAAALPRRPDLVLMTGDLADQGADPEYRRLRDIVDAAGFPVITIPGNHDRRAEMSRFFPPVEHAVNARMDTVRDGLPLTLIGLDTVREGADEGYFEDDQALWLDGVLAKRRDKPVLIFMHHPPVATGFRLMDTIRLEPVSAARLAAVVSRHANIRRVVCGHVHRSLQVVWEGVMLSVCPSTAFQIEPDFEAEDYRPSIDEPPAYQLHFWADGELTTHTVTVT